MYKYSFYFSLPSHNDLFVLSNRLLRRSGRHQLQSVTGWNCSFSLISEIMPLCLSPVNHFCFGEVGQRSLDPLSFKARRALPGLQGDQYLPQQQPFPLLLKHAHSLENSVKQSSSWIFSLQEKALLQTPEKLPSNNIQLEQSRLTDTNRSLKSHLSLCPSLIASLQGLGPPLLHGLERAWPAPCRADASAGGSCGPAG